MALLQYHVATLINNDKPSICKPDKSRSGKPLKTYATRISSKEGRIRGNLMGKRVDFTSRTVITAGPNLSIEEVGVPISIASNLTIPDLVTEFNIDALQHLVDMGPNYFPGANYVIRKGRDRRTGLDTDIKVDLRFAKKVKLQVGWKVERHLRK